MFEIRFQGLITQATAKDSGGVFRQRAVLYVVSAMPHIALLTINVNDRVSGDTEDYSTNDARCYKLDGKSVETGLPDGIPANHLTGVPSLSDKRITTGTILKPLAAIGDLTPTADFGLVKVPDGALLVRNWFKDQALFGSDVFPVPRTVVFTTYAATDVTFTIKFANGSTYKTVTVKKDAAVYITNFPIDNSMPMPHFETMKAFFDQSSGAVTVKNPNIVGSPAFPLGADDDKHDTCAISHQLSVECSNTQFP